MKLVTIAVGSLLIVCVALSRLGEPNRDEATAITTIRAIQSGELAYAEVNNGYYDTLECLASRACVPGLDARAVFLEPQLANIRDRAGYQFQFLAGSTAEPSPLKRQSRSALKHFAVVAIPLDHTPTDRRAFCADDTNVIYVTNRGSTTLAQDGRCIDSGGRLR